MKQSSRSERDRGAWALYESHLTCSFSYEFRLVYTKFWSVFVVIVMNFARMSRRVHRQPLFSQMSRRVHIWKKFSNVIRKRMIMNDPKNGRD